MTLRIEKRVPRHLHGHSRILLSGSRSFDSINFKPRDEQVSIQPNLWWCWNRLDILRHTLLLTGELSEVHGYKLQLCVYWTGASPEM